MQRLHKENINTSENSSARFNGTLGVHDMERFEKLAKYFKGGSYVDVGAFDSPMPMLLAERYPKSEIHSLDFAEEIVKFLKPRFPKVIYHIADIREGLPFKDESVDYVVAGEVIEHMEDPAAFVKELFRIVKKGGYVAISTPFDEISRNEKIGGPFHIWSFDKEDFNQLLGNPEIELHREGRYDTMIAWKQKSL